MWETPSQKLVHPNARLPQLVNALWNQYQRDHVFRNTCSWLREMAQGIELWSSCENENAVFIEPRDKKRMGCVFVNGNFVPALSSLPAGILVAPLREARALFQKNSELDLLEEVHSCLRGEEGTVIYIPAGQNVKPSLAMRYHYVCDEANNDKKFGVPYIVFVLGKGASATIEMETEALPKNFHLFGQTQCFLEEDAELVLTIKPFPEGVERVVWANRVAIEQKGACAIVQEMYAMKGWFRNSFALKGESAHGESLVKVIGGGQLGVYNTMHHDAQATSSRQNIRSILDDGCFTFEGGIHISPKGSLSNAYQKHDTLLLNNRASVTTFPRLEILTDDVKASHGATVGSLNSTLLTYLRSRGFSLADAKQMLQKSFLTLGIEKDYFPKLKEQGLCECIM